MILNKKTSIYLILISILIPLITVIISGYSFSLQITDDYGVMSPGVEYNYVIVIKNEGFSNATSNIISVKDKLPEGLEFIGFDNDQDTWSKSPWCSSGRIVNGSSGLKYDENTRTVSFKVSNLEDGCNISVALKVRALDTTTRVDMYNTAKATVNGKNIDSNIVYSYIGPESSERYKVTYNIVGLDENKTAVATPVEKEYTVGQTVGTELPSEIDGYIFSGFTSSDVTISNDKFVMPNKNVTITGTYVSSNETKHKLKFAISDSSIKDIILPKDKEFKTGETLNTFDIVYRYCKEYNPQQYYYDVVLRFGDYILVDYNLPSDVEVDESGYFQMPDNDTTLTLVFEKTPNMITYRFEGDIVPKTAEMPKSTANPSEAVKHQIDEEFLNYVSNGYNYYGYSIHNVGDTVKLKNDYKSTTCIDKSDNNKEVKCRFIGWYQNDEFVMPGYNLDVFGKWMKINDTFAPEMNLVVLNPKEKYEKGDVVEFKTTIKNTASVDIKNLVINNNFKEQTIKEGNGYRINGDQIIIDEIKANSAIEIFSNFLVGENIDKTFTNQLQLIAADAPAGYYLENDEYIVETEFDTQKVGGEEVIEPVNETEENKTIIDEQTTPKTGDEVYIYIIGAIISLLLIVGLVFVLVKNKKKSE